MGCGRSSLGTKRGIGGCAAGEEARLTVGRRRSSPGMERGMGGRRRLRTVGGAGGCNRLLRSSPAGSEEWQEEQRLAFCSTRLQTARRTAPSYPQPIYCCSTIASVCVFSLIYEIWGFVK